jgi:nitroreductase
MSRTVVTAPPGDNRSGDSVPAMEFHEAVERRRMTRNFRATPLDPILLDGLLAEALRAPSAGNTQGRDLVVLEGPEETDLYWKATTDANWRGRSRRFEGLHRAPVVVLAFSDPGAYVERYAEPDKARPGGAEVEWVVPFWHVDAAFAVMTLLLGAADRRLGAAFLGNFRGGDALRAALGVPADRRWLGAVLLGEPGGPDPPSTSALRPRRTVEESVHRGGW